jgi:hypothetical protein
MSGRCESADVRADALANPYLHYPFEGKSGDPVEIAKLDASYELTPFLRGKFIHGSIRVVRVTDEDILIPTRYSDARTAITGTRDTPRNTPRSRGVFRH